MVYHIDHWQSNFMATAGAVPEKKHDPVGPDVLDWDVALEVAPLRPSGTVQVLLNRTDPPSSSIELDS
jgi:hypothetical protein